MDFRAVLIFLCLHIAHASCSPFTIGDRTSAIQDIRQNVKSALDKLPTPEQLANISCPSLNATELLGPEQQQLQRQLPSIKCYLVKLAERIPQLSELLSTTSQHIEDVLFTPDQTVEKNCSLPVFNKTVDRFRHAKCLLHILDERLSTAKFA